MNPDFRDGLLGPYVLGRREPDLVPLAGQGAADGVLAASGPAEPVIPPNPTRKHPHTYDHTRYKASDKIERLIGGLNASDGSRPDATNAPSTYTRPSNSSQHSNA